jgi:hypothetical protein
MHLPELLVDHLPADPSEGLSHILKRKSTAAVRRARDLARSRDLLLPIGGFNEVEVSQDGLGLDFVKRGERVQVE